MIAGTSTAVSKRMIKVIAALFFFTINAYASDGYNIALDKNIIREFSKASCVRLLPISEGEMKDWLNAYAKSSHNKDTKNVFGIEFRNESSLLIKLAEKLLSKNPISSEVQKKYSSSCKKVYCAMNEIFGEKIAIQLLYMLARFSYNGSHLRASDTSPWTTAELDDVILALNDLPDYYIPSVFGHYPLVHFERGKTLEMYANGGVFANAVINIFDNWSELSPVSRRLVIFHEVAHNIETEFNFSPSWRSAAHWNGKLNLKPEEFISLYASTNSVEDFAETFVAYRFSPERLKAASESRYQYMKNTVFKGREFLGNDCRNDQLDDPSFLLAQSKSPKQSLPSELMKKCGEKFLFDFISPSQATQSALQLCVLAGNLNVENSFWATEYIIKRKPEFFKDQISTVDITSLSKVFLKNLLEDLKNHKSNKFFINVNVKESVENFCERWSIIDSKFFLDSWEHDVEFSAGNEVIKKELEKFYKKTCMSVHGNARYADRYLINDETLLRVFDQLERSR